MDERYTRQIRLDEIGISGQRKLQNAKVLVIGAGGLGCPILLYLSASGIGTLGIADFDTVSVSNLHRQILYSAKHVGHNKALVAKEKLLELNSDTLIKTYPTAFTANNCLEIIEEYDFVVDATDNFTTRYLINDSCLILKKSMIFGALYKFEGQVSVFNYKNGPSYRCLFPKPPAKGEVPNCNEIGVLGVLPGIIGLIQANEVIKAILEIGDILSGKILYLNTLNYKQRILKFSRNEEIISEILKKGKPEPVATDDCIFTKYISLNEISDMEKILWIDVRELGEKPVIDEENVLNMPLNGFEITKAIQNDGSKKIFFCQSGIRSQKATQLAMQKNLLNCFSLREGAAELSKRLKQKK